MQGKSEIDLIPYPDCQYQIQNEQTALIFGIYGIPINTCV